MPDRNDNLDSWLTGRVEPLPPPPGTFDLIKRRSRRRKYRRLAVTTATAAVVVAAAVTVPQVVNLPVLSPKPASGTSAGHSTQYTPGGGKPEATGNTPTPTQTARALAPVPSNFRPTSVTFIGTQTGWVIGQAGTPGNCATQYCTSVARTSDAGHTWSGGPAPETGAPDGSTGVGAIRFLNYSDGWAFGPELWSTHDGGKKWAQVGTDGLRVTDLETVGARAFAVFASCTGTGASFAADCTSFSLYSTSESADNWTPVGASTTGLTSSGGQPSATGAPATTSATGAAGTGAAGTGAAAGATSGGTQTSGATSGTTGSARGASAAIVLTGTKGYLLGPDGWIYSGPVDGSGGWQRTGQIPCSTGSAQANGQPSGALLGAVNSAGLVLVCAGPQSAASDQQKKTVFASKDSGSSWQQVSTAPETGIATSIAASPVETYVLGTDQGIEVLPQGTTAWRPATLTRSAPTGGFSFVGMTDDSQGVALPADPSGGAVWFTYDAGQTWQPSPLANS